MVGHRAKIEVAKKWQEFLAVPLLLVLISMALVLVLSYDNYGGCVQSKTLKEFRSFESSRFSARHTYVTRYVGFEQ